MNTALQTVVLLTPLGCTLGLVLGVAAYFLRVTETKVVSDIVAVLPGSQCGQCGYVGCGQLALALAAGLAAVTSCVPGGTVVARKLSTLLGASVDLSGATDPVPRVAWVDEALCIGCTRCSMGCQSDAIVGAPKQVHFVLEDNCSACGKCEEQCPVMAIKLKTIPLTPGTWYWPKPSVTH